MVQDFFFLHLWIRVHGSPTSSQRTKRKSFALIGLAKVVVVPDHILPSERAGHIQGHKHQLHWTSHRFRYYTHDSVSIIKYHVNDAQTHLSKDRKVVIIPEYNLIFHRKKTFLIGTVAAVASSIIMMVALLLIPY